MARAFGKGIREGVRKVFVLRPASHDAVARHLRDEVNAHVDARVAYLVSRGMSPDTARIEAISRFGGDLDKALEVLEVSAQQTHNSLGARERIDSILQDARFVLRSLRRAPAFTFGVIATFGLGLGINSAVFRVADRVLLRTPAGISQPAELRRLATVLAPSKTSETEGNTFSYPETEIIAGSNAFARLGIYTTARGLRTPDGHELGNAYVDSGFFATLRVTPFAGRLFEPGETAAGAGIAVAVVSYDYWTTHFAGKTLTDAALTINDKKYLVVGVTPRFFSGIDPDPVEVWLPLGMATPGQGTINGVVVPWYRMNMFRGMKVIGRLANGSAEAGVALRAHASLKAMEPTIGALVKSLTLRTIRYSGATPGKDAPSAMLPRLVAVTFVVLFIACANAANLLLARGLRRRRELSVRMSLGAGRARIVRLLIVESLVLGVLGGGAAALAGFWTSDALRRLIFPDAHWTTTAFDERAILFTMIAALLAGLAAGLAPALQLTRPDLVSALKDNRSQSGRRSHSTRSALVVTQTAFSLSLLIASALLVRSLQQMNEFNIGFEPEGLVTAEFWSPGNSLRNTGDAPAGQFDVIELGARLRRNPNVQAVAFASNAPFGSHSAMTVSVPGEPEADVSSRDGPWYSVVSPAFFGVMHTRFKSGRAFDTTDAIGSQAVVIVNATMARLFWHDGNAYRGCLLVRQSCAKVIGVVEDIHDTRNSGSAPPRYYLPLAQHEDYPSTVLVRSTPQHSAALAAAIRSALPSKSRATIEIIGDRIGKAMRPWRVATLLFGGLGAVALILACVGVYSVVSYMASERTQELGIRMALGATARDIVQLVLVSGLRLVVLGGVLGLVASAVFSRFLTSLLFGVSPLDPMAYTVGVVGLAAIGVLAAMLPAMRVMRTNPTVALRAE